jgi:hypothetical protein
MRKSLNLLAAAALLAALGACNRQPAGTPTPDDERALDNAAAMTGDNSFIDTSPDDQSVNAEDVVDEDEAPPAPTNGAGNVQ